MERGRGKKVFRKGLGFEGGGKGWRVQKYEELLNEKFSISSDWRLSLIGLSHSFPVLIPNLSLFDISLSRRPQK